MADYIDRQMAIDAVRSYYDECDEQEESIEERIERLPSAQPDVPDTTFGNMISRQSAIDALHGYFDGMLETDTWSPCDVYGLIEIMPSAEAEPVRHGRWIDTETSYADGVQQKCQCSVCKRLSPRPLGDFCRWCGTDMRGDT